jgi:ribosomal protein L40E
MDNKDLPPISSKNIQCLVCSRCNQYKPIKAKSLCNSCYTHEQRQKTKESSKEEERYRKLEQKYEETKKELERERQKNSNTLESSSSDTQSTSSSVQSNLALAYVQEKTVEPLHYDEKYQNYLETCKKKSQWSGWNENKLILHFPCLSLFVEKYKEDVWAKRTKVERDLMGSGRVESKSLTQTKGRIITITGQFFALMEMKLPNESFEIEDIFSLKRVRMYLKFLEDLSREPCTIRNTILTLKAILKQFLTSSTFALHQKEIQETAQFLDQESSRKKLQEFNKVTPNSEELLESGHFMDEEEFSLLIMDLLQQTRCLTQKLQQQCTMKSIHNVLQLQSLCYTLMSLLDGGLRREVVEIIE